MTLTQRKVLIVGGGKIAYDKLCHLLEFTSNIEIIASEISQEMQEILVKKELTYRKKTYEKGDVIGFDIVVVAVDIFQLQEEIFKETRALHCLCNAVDIIEFCDFIFPSYIKKGDLLLAISTSGSSPAMAKQLRIFLENIIPDTIVPFLEEMKMLRATLPKGKDRMKMLELKAKKFIKSWH
jgi:precorrin-2 dehydrogenase/sirohydrochlorin ferrochelatase